MIEISQLYSDYSKLLFKIAYHMLGTISDAEDMIQDVFVKLSRQDISEIYNVKSYLVKMTTNHCINFIQSSRRKRELYLGPWLPEPLPDMQQEDLSAAAERHEQIQYALLVMLQNLNPYERAVFILKETLVYPYQEIAQIIEKSESNCRKIYSRSRLKLKNASLDSGQTIPESQEYINTFIKAVQTGDIEPLISRLLKDVVIISDGGGKVRAAYKPIVGLNRVLAFIKGIHGKGGFAGEMKVVHLNGGSAVELEHKGNIKMVFLFQTDQKCTGLSRIYMVLNPEKLQRLQKHYVSSTKSIPETSPLIFRGDSSN